MNIIDIALIVFILAVVIVSAIKGFLKVVLNIAAYAVAGIFAKILSSPVSEYIYSAFLKVKVTDVLNEILPSGSVSGEIFSVIDKALDSLPPFVSSLAEQFGILDGDMFAGSSVTSQGLSVDVLEAEYLRPIVLSVLAIIVLVVLFIVFSIIFRIAFSFVNKSLTNDKHKTIKNTNRILGGVLGVVKAIIPTGLICAVLNIAAPLVNNQAFFTMVTESYICGFVAELLK